MSTNFHVIQAAFSQMIGAKVQIVSPENEHLIDGPTVSIEQLFQCSHDYTRVPHTRAPHTRDPHTRDPHTRDPCQLDTYVNEERTFNVYVRLPTKTIMLYVSSFDTIQEIKSSIELKTDFPATKCRLRLLSSRDVSDDMTVGELNIEPDTTLYVLSRLRGGEMLESPVTVFKVSLTEFAPEYNFDFTNVVDDGKTYMRGGFKYERPYGWERFALNVVGKYGDDSWLGPNGIRTNSAVGEWPVAYHGTKGNCVAGIIGEGLKIGSRDMYGRGIYTSPSLEIADYFAGTVTDKNRTEHKCVLQSRVDPKRFRVKYNVRNGRDYWISPEGNAVRPYGILLKQIAAA